MLSIHHYCRGGPLYTKISQGSNFPFCSHLRRDPDGPVIFISKRQHEEKMQSRFGIILLSLILSVSDTIIFARSKQTDNSRVSSSEINVDALIGEENFRTKISTHMLKRPYVSVVMVLRNDDYGGRLLDRFIMSISTLSTLALLHGLRMELVVVEWNPPDEYPSIKDAIDWPKTVQNITFVRVVSKVHQQIGCKGWEYEGKNLGISLSQGEFILTTNADIIFSGALVRHMSENLLCEDCYYRINRHDVMDPVLFDDDSTIADVERHCEVHSIRRLRSWGLEWHPLPDGPTPHVEGRDSLEAYHGRNQPRNPKGEHIKRLGLLHHTAAGDFMLMHKRSWHALGGFSRDSFCGSYCDNHTDSYLVAAAAALGLRQVCLDPPLLIYHQEHYRTRQKADCPPENWPRFMSAAARMLASSDWTLGGQARASGAAHMLREDMYEVERWSPLSDSLVQPSSQALRAVSRALRSATGSAPAAVDASRVCAGFTPGMRPGRRAGLYTLIGNYLAWDAAAGPSYSHTARDAAAALGPAGAQACHVAALDALAGGRLARVSAKLVRTTVADARAHNWRAPPSGHTMPAGGWFGADSDLADLLQAVHTMTSAGLAAVESGGGGRAGLAQAEFWLERAALLTAPF
jgi:hypothetical protein